MLDASTLFTQINSANRILLVSHVDPDGDTLGASGALAFYVQESLGKEVSIFCIDEIPNIYAFLNLEKFFIKKQSLQLDQYDLIICMDCADPKRTGIEDELQKSNRECAFSATKNKTTLINIDHHHTNPFFGNYNLVEPKTSSTCEIIYKLFTKQNVVFSKNIANCLLTGITTDTTFFSNAATTSNAVSAGSDLLNYGANIKQIIKNVWKKQTLYSLQIWGRILTQLDYNEKHKTVTAAVTEKEEIGHEIFEGFANFLTMIYEADLILVLTQAQNNLVKASLRTVKDHIDVSVIAKKYGGGGHAKAAGFSVPGKLVKTKNGWAIAKSSPPSSKF